MTYDFGLQISSLPTSRLTSEAIARLDTLYAQIEEHDPKWKLRLEVEQIKDILRQVRMEASLEHLSKPQEALTFLLAHFTQAASVEEIAALLQVSEEMIEGGEILPSTEFDPRRLEVIAKVSMILEGSFTPRGVYEWFYRSRYQLDDKRPIDLLGSEEGNKRVADLAYGGLMGGGT